MMQPFGRCAIDLWGIPAMKLLMKFNLILLLLFGTGLFVVSYMARQFLLDNARTQVLQQAQLMVESARATRDYTSQELKPLLVRVPDETDFVRQTVPAYSANVTFDRLRKTYPEYSYKEATLNPTNPRNRAVEWETDVVNAFRNQADLKEYSGERVTATGPMLYIARPIQIKDPACLACHSVPAAAPASMIKLYGENNGFGWKHMEVIGAQVVSVPMALPIHNANEAFKVFMSSLAAIFVVTFIVLNVMLSVMIIRPIRRMSVSADKISTGDFNVPEFPTHGKDEISILGTSFNRMRRSLAKALKLI